MINSKFLGGAFGFDTFIDNFFIKKWIFILKYKDHIFGVFRYNCIIVEKERKKRKLKCVQTDNGVTQRRNKNDNIDI